MTCSSGPTYYRGNMYVHHTKPYTMPYVDPHGNFHHKEISPTIGDQSSYQPKSMEAIYQACPLGSEQSFAITYPYKNDVQKSNLIIRGPL